MERNEEKMKRQSKTIAIVALAIGVAALTIGFAAFSNTLTISSGATVTPNASDFKVEFSTSADSVTYGTLTPTLTDMMDDDTTGMAGSTIEIKEGVNSISGLSATFTDPYQTATYEFYIHNTGKYTAYLNSIEFENALNSDTFKKCTPTDGTQSDSVDAACEQIKVGLNYDRECFASPESPVDYDAEYKFPYCHTLDLDDHMSVNVEIVYDGEARADEEFTVEFGDINLLFESVAVNIREP